MAGPKKYNLTYFLFVLPALSLFALFFIFPFFSGLYYSLTSWNGISPQKTFVGLKNFGILIHDASYWMAFGNTLTFTVGHVIVVNVIALLLALVLVSGIPFQKSFRVIFFLPNVLSLIIVGQIWAFLLGQASFALGEVTNLPVFKIGWLSDPRIAMYSVIMASIWQAAGWYMLLYVAGLESIPKELYEAARIDGASKGTCFFRITAPLLVSTEIVCFFLSTINSLRVFDIVYSMTGGGPGRATETVILNIYNTTFNSFYYGYGTAQAVVLLLVIMVVSFFQVFFLKRLEVKY